MKFLIFTLSFFGNVAFAQTPAVNNLTVETSLKVPYLSSGVIVGVSTDKSLVARSISSGDLPASGVSAGTYGSDMSVSQIVIDATGRVTSASSVSISYPSGSGVMSVGAVAPVESSGGATPSISMSSATSSRDGYLTSTDWSTFNGKLSSLTFPINAGVLGSDVAPNYQNVDNDSGMYSKGDGNVSFSANGFERLSIDQTLVTVTSAMNISGDTFIAQNLGVSGDVTVTGNISAANYPPTGSGNTMTAFNASGDITSLPGGTFDPGINNKGINIGPAFSISADTYEAVIATGNIDEALDNQRGFLASRAQNAYTQGYTAFGAQDLFSSTASVDNSVAYSDNTSFQIGSVITNGHTSFFANPQFDTGMNTFRGLSMGSNFGPSTPVSVMSAIEIQAGMNVNAGSYMGPYVGLNLGPQFDAGSTGENIQMIFMNPDINRDVSSVTNIAVNPSYGSQGQTNIPFLQDININPAFQASSAIGYYNALTIRPNVYPGATISQGVTMVDIAFNASMPVDGYVKGVNVDLQNVETTAQKEGLSSTDGALFVQSNYKTGNNNPSPGFLQMNQVGGLLEVEDGFPMTNTLVFGDNFGPSFLFNDDMGPDAFIGFGGATVVGFLNQIAVKAGKTVSNVNSLLVAGSVPDVGQGVGHIQQYSAVTAAGLTNGGGAVTVSDAIGVWMPSTLCTFATPNCWGLKVEDPLADNWMSKSLVIGSNSELPRNASVALEISSDTKALLLSSMNTTREGALTSVNGMMMYNEQTNKFRCYEAGSWVDCIGAGGGGVTSVSATSPVFSTGGATPVISISSAESTLIGRGEGSGSGPAQEISIGSGLNLTGTVLTATGGGGPAASQSLDNLVTTAINQNLVFDKVSPAIASKDNGAGSTESLYLLSGNATTGQSGNITLLTGTADDTTTGYVTIDTGASATTDVSSGSIAITTGVADGGAAATGDISLTVGTPTGGAAMGIINLASFAVDLSNPEPTETVAPGIFMHEGPNNGGSFTTIKASDSLAGNTSFVLPPSNGASGTVLGTSGSGVTSWVNRVTSVTAGTGLSGGTITTTGTIALANTAVSAGTYGSATDSAVITVDAQGRITSASSVAISGGGGGSALNISMDNAEAITAFNTNFLPDSDGARNLGDTALRWNAAFIKYIYDGTPTLVANFDTKELSDASAVLSLDWQNRSLKDNTGAGILSYNNPGILVNDAPKILYRGATVSSAANANAGTSATCTVDRANDSRGEITLTTGSASWASGSQCDVTFASAYGTTPVCFLTPANANAALAVTNSYVTQSTSDFNVNFAAADTAATTYIWNYACDGTSN